MKNGKNPPAEVAGFRNALIPTFDERVNCVVEKWFSLPVRFPANDDTTDDDFLPWDSDEGSEIPPF